MKTPVVLLIFNRPDLTRKVFDIVRQAKPKRLLVVADGPRIHKNGELEKCQITREITEAIDWECETSRNYSDSNLGCGKRVSSGLDWVFTQVDKAIILEDDCIPDISFFQFCENLLDTYEADERITMISGMNYCSSIYSPAQSYYFSCHPGIWGWATWRRAWNLYDYEMQDFPKISQTDYLDYIFSNTSHQKFWHSVFEEMYEASEKVTWDYQWLFAQWANNGMAIAPSINLVSNIGHGSDATHTKIKSKIAELATSEMTFPLIHPTFVSRNLRLDNIVQSKFLYKKCYYKFIKLVKKYVKTMIEKV